jgi:hypothetical protein
MEFLEVRTFTHWSAAEFSNASHHNAFCVQHKPYTTLLNSEYYSWPSMDATIFSSLCLLKYPDSSTGRFRLGPPWHWFIHWTLNII